MKCLARRKQRTGDPGPAFVDAIILAVAEATLHVALRRNRQMHAAELAFDVGVETRVFSKIFHSASFFIQQRPPVYAPGVPKQDKDQEAQRQKSLQSTANKRLKKSGLKSRGGRLKDRREESG